MSVSEDSYLDDRYMACAIELARQGWYTAKPNPRVGCVIVADGKIVGEGWHQRAGDAHAEVNALTMAGSLAMGATAYVSLEPCNHQGRTPPCSGQLIAAGVARVVYGIKDGVGGSRHPATVHQTVGTRSRNQPPPGPRSHDGPDLLLPEGPGEVVAA